LGVEHHIVDVSREYKKKVLDNFTSEYQSGRTPNPCVLCNPLIKFGALLDNAEALGIDFDYFATGHYARANFDEPTGRYQLLKAVDLKKDQSYFLYRLKQSQLKKILFPLGEFIKEEVRRFVLAAGFNEIARKPESQDFINENISSTLFSEYDHKPGKIKDLNGKVIGTHNGIIKFTVGQRKGIRIGGQKEPLFVVQINADENSITVGPKAALAVSALTAVNLNWIALEKPDRELYASVKLRSQQKEIPCEITVENNQMAKVTFSIPQFGATPGQSVVFYQGEVVLGGGVIQAVVSELPEAIESSEI
jgi:tRNA-specific 2-thiouridylase